MSHMEDCPYPFTELAERFPVSRGARHAALVARIREHGFRPHILVWRGEVLFGKEYLQAYAEAGVPPVFQTLPDDEEPCRASSPRPFPPWTRTTTSGRCWPTWCPNGPGGEGPGLTRKNPQHCGI